MLRLSGRAASAGKGEKEGERQRLLLGAVGLQLLAVKYFDCNSEQAGADGLRSNALTCPNYIDMVYDTPVFFHVAFSPAKRGKTRHAAEAATDAVATPAWTNAGLILEFSSVRTPIS